jgi:D-glycero-alpha-D-manno-heptose-7-phosphate kinase
MIITKTPLRLSFVGGGTDLPDYYEKYGEVGAVVSATINKFVYITVNRKFDGKIRVSYSKTEIVDHVDDLEHNIIRETLKFVGITHSVEVVYMADLPMAGGGSGLGSSSALTVGALKALYALSDKHVSAEQLASEAYHIERNILNYPVGKQDHYAAAYGGLNYIRFRPDGSVFVDPIVCNAQTKDMIATQMVMFYTDISRISSDILGSQVKIVGEKIEFYRELASMASEFANSLHKSDIKSCHELMRKGWENKKKLSNKISADSFDDWYKKGMNAGAHAGKIAGAGGGGFMFFMCDLDSKKNLENALEDLPMVNVDLEMQGCRIIHLS